MLRLHPFGKRRPGSQAISSFRGDVNVIIPGNDAEFFIDPCLFKYLRISEGCKDASFCNDGLAVENARLAVIEGQLQPEAIKTLNINNIMVHNTVPNGGVRYVSSNKNTLTRLDGWDSVELFFYVLFVQREGGGDFEGAIG